MRILVTGAALLAGFTFAVPAHAAPGQCSVTGYDVFDCDVLVDGGGITFVLPDGQTFVFAHVADGEGLAYRVPADPQPGRYPEELGTFRPLTDKPGCWFGDKDAITFCASVAQ